VINGTMDSSFKDKSTHLLLLWEISHWNHFNRTGRFA